MYHTDCKSVYFHHPTIVDSVLIDNTTWNKMDKDIHFSIRDLDGTDTVLPYSTVQCTVQYSQGISQALSK